MRRAVAAAMMAVALALGAAPAALAATPAPTPVITEPAVPEPVSQYFATGLIPRLADLYGPGKKAGSGITFDSTAKVGDIHRVFVWTTEFLAGKPTATPVRLTNDWVASVTVRDQVVGLATVWINPSSDSAELATFSSGPALVAALASAQKGFVLVHDDAHGAWFATDGVTLNPLVSGTSGLATPSTVVAYQGNLPASPADTPSAGASSGQGLLIAALVLGVVVVLLVIFVLMPDRRRRAGEPDAAAPDPAAPPARAAVSADPAAPTAAIADAAAQIAAHPVAAPDAATPVAAEAEHAPLPSAPDAAETEHAPLTPADPAPAPAVTKATAPAALAPENPKAPAVPRVRAAPKKPVARSTAPTVPADAKAPVTRAAPTAKPSPATAKRPANSTPRTPPVPPADPPA